MHLVGSAITLQCPKCFTNNVICRFRLHRQCTVDCMKPSLFAGSWPQLINLEMHGTRLGLAKTTSLAQAFVPSLHLLKIPGNNLEFEAVAARVHADWPELWSLDLSEQWPRKQGCGRAFPRKMAKACNVAAEWPQC